MGIEDDSNPWAEAEKTGRQAELEKVISRCQATPKPPPSPGGPAHPLLLSKAHSNTPKLDRQSSMGKEERRELRKVRNSKGRRSPVTHLLSFPQRCKGEPMRILLPSKRIQIDRRNGERGDSGHHQRQTFTSPFPPQSPPAPHLPQLTLSMGLVQLPQQAGEEVRDGEAAARTRGCVSHTALPTLQDPNPVPFRQHT